MTPLDVLGTKHNAEPDPELERVALALQIRCEEQLKQARALQGGSIPTLMFGISLMLLTLGAFFALLATFPLPDAFHQAFSGSRDVVGLLGLVFAATSLLGLAAVRLSSPRPRALSTLRSHPALVLHSPYCAKLRQRLAVREPRVLETALVLSSSFDGTLGQCLDAARALER